MKEFVTVSMLILIFAGGALFLFAVDSGYFNETEEPVPDLIDLQSDAVDIQLKEFAKELDEWSIVSDKTNSEYLHDN